MGNSPSGRALVGPLLARCLVVLGVTFPFWTVALLTLPCIAAALAPSHGAGVVFFLLPLLAEMSMPGVG